MTALPHGRVDVGQGDLAPDGDGRSERRAHQLGVLAGDGWIVRDPTGGSAVEKVAAVAAAGFSYLALNARDHRGNAWDAWRIEAARHALPVIPFGRLYDASQKGARAADATAVAVTTLRYLGDTAHEWGGHGVMLNPEDEAEDVITPAEINLLTSDWQVPLAVITDYRGWEDEDGYHGPDYSPLAGRAVGIMEAFDSTATVPISVEACVRRLRLMGFEELAVSPSTKLMPGDYQLGTVRVVPYVLDIVPADLVATWRLR